MKSIPEFRNEKVIVKPFGSVSQTFWTKNSDVDIDLIFPEQLNANPRMLPVIYIYIYIYIELLYIYIYI